MDFRDTDISCGVQQLSGINFATPEQAINLVKNSQPYGVVLFSTNSQNYHKANALVKEILDNDLGTVQESAEAINSIHNSKIKVYVWAVNRKNLRNYFPKPKTIVIPI